MVIEMKNPNPPRVCDVSRVDLNAFARNFSAFFDFPRSERYSRDLVRCARHTVSVERGYESYGGLPPDSFFRHMDKYNMSDVAEACNLLLAGTYQAYRPARPGTVYAAIDLHDVLYWGTDDECVHKKKGALKNVRVLRFATLALVSKGFKYTLACAMIKKGDKNRDVVRGLLETALRTAWIDVVLMDRGFYDTSVFRTVLELGMDYIVPVRKTKRVESLYRESQKTGNWAYEFTLNRAHANKMDVRLYLKEDAEHEYLGLVSSKHIPASDIEMLFQEYNQRANIENSYKEKNQYEIRTTTTKKPLRFLFYCIGHILVNLQQAIRTAYTVFRTEDMKQLIDLLLEGREGKHRLTRTLTVIT